MALYRMPDGTEIPFPDNATPEQITAAVNEHYGQRAPAGQPANGAGYVTQASLDAGAGGAAPAPAPAAPTGPQQLTGLPRYAGLAGQAVARGLVSMAGLPGDLETLGTNYLANPVARLFGGTGDDMSDPANHVFPTSQRILGGLAQTPLASLFHSDNLTVGAGDYPTAERYGTAGLEALTGGLAMGGVGGLTKGLISRSGEAGAQALAGAGQGAVAGLAGGEGSQAAQDMFPGSPLAGGVGGLVAGLAGGGGLKVATDKLALRGANAAVAAATPAEQAARYASTDTSLANRGNSLTRDAERGQALLDNQSAHDSNVAAATQAHLAASAQAETALKQARVSLGGDHTFETAGGVGQSTTQAFIANQVPAMHDGYWAPVDAAVPGETPVPLDGFRQHLEDINTAGGTGQNILNTVTSSLPRALQRETEARLAPQPALQGLDDVMNGTTPEPVAPPPLTWNEVRPLRQAIGSAIGNPKLSGGASDQQLRGLYGALSDDMRGALQGLPDAVVPGPAGAPVGGPPTPESALQALNDARSGARPSVAPGTGPAPGTVRRPVVDLFNEANEQSQALHQLVEGTFGKMVSASTPQVGDPLGGQAVKTLLNTGKVDGTLLSNYRTHVPEAANAMGSALLTENPSGWNNLTPSAKLALVGDPGRVATLDSALGAQTAAEQGVKTTTAASLAQKQLADQAANQAHSQGTAADRAAQLAADIQREASRRQLAAAQVRLGNVTPASPTHNSGALQSLLGSSIGGAGTTLAGQLSGAVDGASFTHGLGGLLNQHSALGALLGAAAPLAYKGLRTGAAQPLLPIMAAGLGGGAVPPSGQLDVTANAPR